MKLLFAPLRWLTSPYWFSTKKGPRIRPRLRDLRNITRHGGVLYQSDKQLSKAHQARIEEFRKAHGRNPTFDEMMAWYGVNDETLRVIYKFYSRMGYFYLVGGLLIMLWGVWLKLYAPESHYFALRVMAGLPMLPEVLSLVVGPVNVLMATQNFRLAAQVVERRLLTFGQWLRSPHLWVPQWPESDQEDAAAEDATETSSGKQAGKEEVKKS